MVTDGKWLNDTDLLTPSHTPKLGGREGSIESQQKFDFFSYDGTPKINTNFTLITILQFEKNVYQ